MMPGYRVVDLRNEVAPGRSSWGNSPKTAGVTLHYNGDPAPQRAWDKPIQWIRFINDLHKQPGRFAPNWTINGIAYCEWALGDTIYRLRDYAADLPHCGNLFHNKNSLSIHIPVGGRQLPQSAAKGTMLTALRRADDHLAAMNLGRQSLRGHREVGPSACPGEPIMEQLRLYRQGMDVQPPKGDGGEKPPDSPVQSAPSGTVFRVIAGAFGERSNAQTRANQIKAKGFGEPWVYKHGSYWRCQAGSFTDQRKADEMVQRLKAAGFESYSFAEKT